MSQKTAQRRVLLNSKELAQRPIKKIDLPELAENPNEVPYVNVAGLPAGDVLKFARMTEGPERDEKLMELIAAALCDDNGSCIFKSAEEALETMQAMEINAFNRIVKAVVGDQEALNPTA